MKALGYSTNGEEKLIWADVRGKQLLESAEVWSVKTQLFQKLQEINPKKDLTIIIRGAESSTPASDLIRPYLQEYQGVNLILTGRRVSEKVEQTLQRRAQELGSEIWVVPPKAQASQGGLRGLIAAVTSCTTEYFVLTDADALHPIELINDLVTELDYGADLAVCSRVHSSAFERGFQFLLRQARSSLARVTLRRNATPVRDPYSTYFAGRTSKILATVRTLQDPAGTKDGQTLLELLRIFGRSGRIAEVNYLTPTRFARSGELQEGV